MSITHKHISAVDLDLLPALDALLRRRNITHAGRDVGLSQPAMSRALGRLRALFDDPLLVRQAGGFALTPRAERLAPQIAAALEQIDALFRAAPFDPAAERRVIRLAAADAQLLLLAPEVARRLTRSAPGVKLEAEAYGPETIARLRQGKIDFAFALSSTPLPPGARSMPLGEDRLMLVTRRGHPLTAGVATIADYARFPHAAVAIFGDGRSEIDAVLAAHRLSREIALTTPNFIVALAAVGASDCITTMSELLARRFADAFGLALAPSPLSLEPLTLTLVWDRLRTSDPALVWFRDLLRDVAATIYPQLGAS